MSDSTTTTLRRPRTRQNRRKPRRGGALTFLRDLFIIVLAALLVSFLVKTFLVRSFWIPSGSMENTLQVNDRVVVDELVPNVIPVHRGDIIVFTDPGGWLAGENLPNVQPTSDLGRAFEWLLTQVGLGTADSDNHLIKRVIGLPGDHVSCCNDLGQMSVNGVPLAEPYITLPSGKSAASGTSFSVTVPANSLWVMGDNRYDSKDSRYNRTTPSKGFVPMSDVVGRAFVISWPADRWRWLSDYSSTFAGVGRAKD
ncbi:signal peptidase I [Curtobacterium ammoniigenes]|uniref:signal peptidase I n=1 Tax=Curtobacterium ammoniigenes TaxID=395387 RepID=UPI00082EE6D6|nr:signal peptidase I [Curtobacterium ammoniigenes]